MFTAFDLKEGVVEGQDCNKTLVITFEANVITFHFKYFLNFPRFGAGGFTVRRRVGVSFQVHMYI